MRCAPSAALGPELGRLARAAPAGTPARACLLPLACLPLRPTMAAVPPPPSRAQGIIAAQNCTTGFDAAALKQQIKDSWGVDVWLTCNPS